MREYPFYHYVIALIQRSRYHLHISEHVNLPTGHFIIDYVIFKYFLVHELQHQLKKIEVRKKKQEMTCDSFAYLNLKSLPPSPLYNLY